MSRLGATEAGRSTRARAVTGPLATGHATPERPTESGCVLSHTPVLGDVDISARSLRRQMYIRMGADPGALAERRLYQASKPSHR